MSTVALKGKLEWIETKEAVQLNLEHENGMTGESNENEDGAVTIGDKSTNATMKAGKWIWKGKWAFGTHIDETVATPRSKSAHKLQPFHYCFEEVADPATVAVPSLTLLSSLPTNPNTTENSVARIEDDPLPEGVKSHSVARQGFEPKGELSLHTISSRDDDASPGRSSPANHARNDSSTWRAGGRALGETEEKPKRQDLGPTSSTIVQKKNDIVNTSSRTCHDIAKEKSAIPGSLAGIVEATTVPPQMILQSSSIDGTGTKDDAIVNNQLKACTNDQRKDFSRHYESGQILLGKRSLAENVNKDTPIDSAQADENYETMLKVSDASCSVVPKQLEPFLSFAAVSSSDPPFTEALSFVRQQNDSNPTDSTSLAMDNFVVGNEQNLCPSSGLWKGYFQNATSVGRGKGTRKIHEEFYLFLNACPGENASFAFNLLQNQMPPTHVSDPVLVRGRGENQFGTFEICGYLDTATMEMEIQRQYVHVEEESTARNPSPSKKKKQRLSTPVVTRHKSARHTRKRQPSWKVKSQEENVEDEPYKRKRRKSSMEIACGNSDGYSNGGTTPSSMISNGSVASRPDSTLLSTASAMNNVGTSRTPVKRKSLSPIGNTRRRGPGAGSFKTSPKQMSATLTTPSTVSMRLPPTGGSQKSKWRTAHFLYYQRHDPEEQHSQQEQHPQQQHTSKQMKHQSSPGSASTSAISTNPKYVIYEGEMVDSRREGRGICLYSNNMLYEGEWRRNKEHGYGKVMTTDRTRIIYEGEFERGRMQGLGTYYFEQAEHSKCGARYIGEFKENMRHGIGKYFLPDKSVYDGMWNNGLMNGRGVFTWPDNSIYDGEWKDGKRTGQGILKTLDGFYYDGMWVNNAMEGRGFAVYPNGQKYEGLFSKGRREGRGTLTLTNGVVYEGRFRDDGVDGQGTMKMSRTTVVPTKDGKDDFMIPISFQSDMSHIHTKAGFTSVGD